MTEEIWARLSVLAPLAMGHSTASLVFTDKRVIVAFWHKTSTRLVVGSAETHFLGLIGPGRKSKKAEKADSLEPDELLRVDKSNFDIRYDEIVRFDLVVKSPGTELVIVTQSEKWVFQLSSKKPPEGFDQEASQILGDRFTRVVLKGP